MADNLRACRERAYEQFWEPFDPCFAYKKTARRACEYVRGLMATLERKNGWQLAEFIGDSSPYAVQNFLSRAIWSADRIRDQLTKSAMETILEKQEAGSLIIDLLLINIFKSPGNSVVWEKNENLAGLSIRGLQTLAGYMHLSYRSIYKRQSEMDAMASEAPVHRQNMLLYNLIYKNATVGL